VTIALPQSLYRYDRPISDLRTAELLIVTTLRLRAMQWRKPHAVDLDWRGGFEAGDLPLWAIDMFDDLFQIVAVVTPYPLDVGDLHYPRLGVDEKRILQILSLFQHAKNEQAKALLKDWLPAAACRLATYPAASLAVALQRAKFLIPLPGASAAITQNPLEANPVLTRMQ
jgi:hypothetical protein